jgi:hydrogenase expression/formation protein HypE
MGPRSYAQPVIDMQNSTRLIRAVLFDFDGTLTEPGSLDFNVIRNTLGCPKGRPVLEFIHGIVSPAERAEAFRILNEFETEAARQSRPNAGAEEVIEFLRARGLKVGIISRNSLDAIQAALKNFERLQPSHFALILSRDDPFSPKPSPEGILAAAGILDVAVAQLLVVGDFVFDVEAGHKAGALTAFLTNRGSSQPCVYPANFVLDQLSDLKEIIQHFAPLTPGNQEL